MKSKKDANGKIVFGREKTLEEQVADLVKRIEALEKQATKPI